MRDHDDTGPAINIEEGEVFRLSRSDAKYLRALLGGTLETRPGGWAVNGVAGHVALPSGATLRMRSRKAAAASVLAWAAFVDPCLSALRFLGGASQAGELGDVGPLLARLYLRQIVFVASRHGLIRNYRSLRVRRSTLRGRIDFTELARRGGILSTVPCIVWERLPNTPLNQFLAATLQIVRQDPVMRQVCGSDLHPADAVLEGVRPRIHPRILSGREALPRNERPFESACAIARLLLRGAGLVEGSTLKGPTFILRLDSLFERAVIRSFLDAGVPAVPKKSMTYRRSFGAGLTPSSRRPAMELDLLLTRPDGAPVVVDAKYKAEVNSANLQQAVTYCYLAGAERAVLVTAGDEASHRETYIFDGPGLTHGDRPARVMVSVVSLATGSVTVDGWREAGQAMVETVKRLAWGQPGTG